MKKILIRLSIFIFLSFSFVLSPVATLRASAAPCQPKNQVLGLPTWYKYLDGQTIGGKCSPVISEAKGALPIGLAILELILTLSGLVAIVFVIVGGFRFVLSVGEPAKAASARQTVLNALIGLLIVIVSTRAVSFIAGRIV